MARPKEAAAAEDAGGVRTGEGTEWLVFDGTDEASLSNTKLAVEAV